MEASDRQGNLDNELASCVSGANRLSGHAFNSCLETRTCTFFLLFKFKPNFWKYDSSSEQIVIQDM